MKKIISVILLLVILLSPLAIKAESYNKAFNLEKLLKYKEDYLIDYKIKRMSLAAKVGQLFQVGFHSKTPAREIKDLIKNYQIGGVIYFKRNIENLEQTAALSKKLQKIALNNNSKLPLFIAVDQEGGPVRRIKDLTYFPANMALGAVREKKLSRKRAAATGAELKKLGININLAPVLDLNNNPNNPVIGLRSFAGDPKIAAEMGTAYIEGLQSAGISAAAKHFPGHGDTAVDSHTQLPVINKSMEKLKELELYPFKKAIAADVDLIMAAHIYFPALESKAGLPATLSKALLNDLLREELNFKGLIITDDLEMAAVANSFSTAEAAVRTVKAGSDLILIAHSYQQQKAAVDAVKKAVQTGRISEKRIEKSVKRIIKLKAKRINYSKIKAQFKPADINFKKHEKLSQKIIEKSLTVIKNDKVLPLKKIREKKVSLIDFKERKKPSTLSTLLNKEIVDFNYLAVNQNNYHSKLKKVENIKRDLIIITTQGRAEKKIISLAEKLAENNKVLFISYSNPYLYNYINQTQAFITFYGHNSKAEQAAANFILNKIESSAQLPLNLSLESNY